MNFSLSVAGIYERGIALLFSQFGIALVVLILIMLMPIVTYLFVGWENRKREILSGLSSKENEALKLYFDQFHPEYMKNEPDVLKRFHSYYDRQFGKKNFLLPLFLFAVLLALNLGIALEWVRLWYPQPNVLPPMGLAIAVMAILGAVVWILSSHIAKFRVSDFAPMDLYIACLRLIIAIPIAFAFSSLVADSLKPAIAFLLGAFPTTTLLSFARRIVRQKMNFGDDGEGAESELQILQGIDFRKAERFSNEGITTILQLAYADPIKLTILTNLGYSYIVDCMSQALLWIYLEKDLEKFRKVGLRGAYEVENLWIDLKADDPQIKTFIAKLPQLLGYDEVALMKIYDEVAEDPYTQFIYASWSGDPVPG
jgi:hypothetical protein